MCEVNGSCVMYSPFKIQDPLHSPPAINLDVLSRPAVRAGLLCCRRKATALPVSQDGMAVPST